MHMGMPLLPSRKRCRIGNTHNTPASVYTPAHPLPRLLGTLSGPLYPAGALPPVFRLFVDFRKRRFASLRYCQQGNEVGLCGLRQSVEAK